MFFDVSNVVQGMYYLLLVYRMKSINNEKVRDVYGLGEKKEMIWLKFSF